MHARHDPPPPLWDLARTQGGVLSREQATHFLPDRSIQRLVGDGSWRRLESGLYLTQRTELDFWGKAWAGVLAAGEGSLVAEHAAGHLHGLCHEAPARVTVLVPHECRRAAPEGTRFLRRRDLPRPRGLLPRTDADTTVLDLCATEPSNTIGWATAALRRRLTTTSSLRDALAARKRMPAQSRKVLTEFLMDGEGVESPLEHRYATAVEKAHGLPRGERQFRRGSARHDVRYGRLLVELDGRLGHSDVEDEFRDMQRDNQALTEGLVTLRYGHVDCWQRACNVARQVHSVLVQLGGAGSAHACRHCRNSKLWP